MSETNPNKITRTIDGVVDFCIGQIEATNLRDDLKPVDRAKIVLGFLKEARGFVTAGLQNKRMYITAPEAMRGNMVIPIGTQPEPEQDKVA